MFIRRHFLTALASFLAFLIFAYFLISSDDAPLGFALSAMCAGAVMLLLETWRKDWEILHDDGHEE
jgi:hypothetical protein